MWQYVSISSLGKVEVYPGICSIPFIFMYYICKIVTPVTAQELDAIYI